MTALLAANDTDTIYITVGIVLGLAVFGWLGYQIGWGPARPLHRFIAFVLVAVAVAGPIAAHNLKLDGEPPARPALPEMPIRPVPPVVAPGTGPGEPLPVAMLGPTSLGGYYASRALSRPSGCWTVRRWDEKSPRCRVRAGVGMLGLTRSRFSGRNRLWPSSAFRSQTILRWPDVSCESRCSQRCPSRSKSAELGTMPNISFGRTFSATLGRSSCRRRRNLGSGKP